MLPSLQQKKESVQNEMDEIIKDFEFFLKAQLEKQRLIELEKQLSHDNKSAAKQQIDTVEQILRQTRNRLKLNVQTKESKFNGSFQAFKQLDTFLEIKNYLTKITPNVRKQNFKFHGQEEQRTHSEESENSFDQVKERQDFLPNDILRKSKNLISLNNSRKFFRFSRELENSYNQVQQNAILVKDFDDHFYNLLGKQINQEESEIEVKRKNQLIEQKLSSTNFGKEGPQKRMFGSTSQNIFLDIEQQRKSTLVPTAENLFKLQALKLRQAMKKVSEQVFIKKWGNSKVKTNRYKQKELTKYEQQQQSMLKTEIKEKLVNYELPKTVRNSILTCHKDLNFPILEEQENDLQQFQQSFSSMTPKTITTVNFSPNKISIFGQISTIRGSKQVGQLQQHLSVNKNKLKTDKKQQKVSPPAQIESLRQVGKKIIDAANIQYDEFLTEKNDMRQKLNVCKHQVGQAIYNFEQRNDWYKKMQ